ncbi:MAG: TldD/PmbA family protein [bacterium]
MDIEKAVKEAVMRIEAQSLDAFEVVGLVERSLIIESKQQMIDRALRSERRGISIRAIKGGRMGLASTADMNPKSVITAVRSALASVESVSPSDEVSLPEPQPEQGKIEEVLKRTLSDVPYNDKARFAMEIESAAIAHDSRISKVQQARYGEDVRALFVVNSRGVRAKFERGFCHCAAKAVSDDGRCAQSGFEQSFSASFDDIDPAWVGRTAAKRAVDKLGAAPAPGGTASVVFEPRAAASMLALLAPSFFADNVQRGKSMLAGKRGECVFNAAVTIVDDGLLPHGCNSFAFDWEGIPKRRTVLVRDGEVESWLYDGARAAKDRVQSTGSCVREGLERQPAVGVSNCFLKAGGASPESLLVQADRGFLITDLLGLHTANPISGAFSLGVEGFVVKEGARREPVRGMTIAGNVHELFGRIVAVGNNLRFVGSFGAPAFFAEGMVLGS